MIDGTGVGAAVDEKDRDALPVRVKVVVCVTVLVCVTVETDVKVDVGDCSLVGGTEGVGT